MTASLAEPRMLFSLQDIRFGVHLGCGPEERVVAQPVRLDVRLFFPALPDACIDDNAEFLCYDELTSELKKVAQRGEFRLIEYLAKECYDAVRQLVGSEIQIWLKLTKIQPPVPELHGGACIILCDPELGLPTG